MLKQLFYIFILLHLSCFAYSQKFSLLVEGGRGYRLFAVQDSIPQEYQTYQSSKKKGTLFAIEPVWFNENQGFGIKYAVFLNSVTADSIKVSALEHKSLSEDLKLHYWGLQYHYRYQLGDSKFYTEFVAGLGMILYRNKRTEYKSDNFDIQGRTYALNTSALLEYKIIKKLSFYISGTVYISKIETVTENGISVTYNPKESLTRADLNCGLRLNIY